ncbi:hypothetical protein GVAV_001493 [Gurleya vavrai]
MIFIKDGLNLFKIIIYFLFIESNEVNAGEIELRFILERANKNISVYYYFLMESLFMNKEGNLTLILNTNSCVIDFKCLNDKNYAVFANSMQIPNIKIVNLKNLENEVKNAKGKPTYYLSDPTLINFYKSLKNLNQNILLTKNLFRNDYSYLKKNILLGNINLFESLIQSKILDNNNFKNSDLQIIKCGTLYTIHYTPIFFDDIHFIKSFPYQSFEEEDNYKARYFYDWFKDLWNKSIKKIDEKTSKMDWIDFIIEDSLKILLTKKLLVKKVDLRRTPELISYLFPIKFTCTEKENFVNFEMIRYCISFKTIKEFDFYNEYFNDDEMKYYIEKIPEVCFTDFLDNRSVVKLNDNN